MAVPREKVYISAAGKPGEDAVQYFGHRDHVAQFARQGANGRSATSPSAGTDGRDISVTFSWSERDNALLVEGTKGWKGPEDGQTRWLVPQERILLLDAKGGDGGRGGNGEPGQQGGQGRRGADATKHRDAEDGHEGARGGDGGYGSNGANGGNAGKILITVNEDDLDLLVPVYWNILGGKGGESGHHGEPGDGGLGGDPGDGITWTEYRGDTKYTTTKPPGRRGPVGPPGARAPSYLQGGIGGAQGSSQVTVMRNNGTQATYPGRYNLEVVSFEVVDENNDNVNEPGEHIFVTNIRVKNSGGMPSPKNHAIQVLIHGTHWLDPIASEPVYLPYDIPVDEVVNVPGTLRAFIMQERVPREPGTKFLAKDDVQLIATMPRINRAIPEFMKNGGTKIDIKYPLELDPPKYLDCVAPGNNVTFSWTLRNISSKPYGIQGGLRRGAATCLKDPGGLFNFIEAEADHIHEMVDSLEVLDPMSEVPISQTFKVSDMAFPFTNGSLTLQLLLSEPGIEQGRFSDVDVHHVQGQTCRSVMSYPMHMQISGVYSYNPDSAFLLVVNSGTPNAAIHQLIAFIRNDLKLRLDIYNLSVKGTFIDEHSKQNLLSNYVGKSVIIFGNQFNYFNQGMSSAFDLLDPWLACRLAGLGTSFHFAGVTENFEAMKTWAAISTFPVYAYNPTPTPESTYAATFKELALSLHSTASPNAPPNLPVHAVPAKKSMFGNPDSSLASASQKVAKQLNKQFPLRRYAVTGDPVTRTPELPGTVIIREGFPKTACISASLMEYSSDDGDLADYQKYMIISSLPFHIRANMFWNMAGILDAGGISSHEIMKGKTLSGIKPIISVTTHEITAIPEKICKAICLSIEYDLGREIGDYTIDAPYFDPIPKEFALQQLPLLTKFLNVEPPSTIIGTNDRTEFIIQTLGVIQGSLLSFGGGEGFRRFFTPCVDRKARLKSQVDLKIQEFLTQRFTPEVVAQLKTTSLSSGKQDKATMKTIPGAKSTTAVTLSRLSALVQIQNATFLDLTTINPNTVSWTKPATDGQVGVYHGHSNAVKHREAHSTGLLNEMVQKI